MERGFNIFPFVENWIFGDGDCPFGAQPNIEQLSDQRGLGVESSSQPIVNAFLLNSFHLNKPAVPVTFDRNSH